MTQQIQLQKTQTRNQSIFSRENKKIKQQGPMDPRRKVKYSDQMRAYWQRRTMKNKRTSILLMNICAVVEGYTTRMLSILQITSKKCLEIRVPLITYFLTTS